MKETLGWVLTGVLAGVVMFSLATAHDPAPSMNDPIKTAAVPLATLEGPAESTAAATALADAYFSIARSGEAAESGRSDWLVRHEITLKGFDAEQGLSPRPEHPTNRGLAHADELRLAQAYAIVEEQNQRNARGTDPVTGDVIALTAALQAQYDWWLLGCEARWDDAKLTAVQQRFEDTLNALETARARNSLAAL